MQWLFQSSCLVQTELMLEAVSSYQEKGMFTSIYDEL